MTFEKAVSVEPMPPLVEISEVLATRDWKITDHTTERIRAKRVQRPPSYTVGDGVMWYLEFVTRDDSGEVSATIPAMVRSGYAEKRVLGLIATILDATGCEYETGEPLEVDVLAQLRAETGRE